MKISSSFYNQNDLNNDSVSFKGVPSKPFYIPECIGTLGKYAGEYIDSPEQRLFLALATVAVKPLIDLKFAQDDKKVDTAIKSAAKGMSGGLTGVAIRAAFLKLTDKFIGYDVINNKLIKKQNALNQLFFPNIAKELNNESVEIIKLRTKKYSNTLGSLFAILFMILFSNSKIDVPLTNDMQDLLSGVVKENKSWVKSAQDVTVARGKKIIDWFVHKKDIFKNIADKAKDIFAILKDNNSQKQKEAK